MTFVEAGALVGLTPHTIRLWVREGVLTGFRVGPHLFAIRSDVEATVKERGTRPKVPKKGGGAQRILVALAEDGPDLTIDEIATTALVARNTARSYLFGLARDGLARRAKKTGLWSATAVGHEAATY